MKKGKRRNRLLAGLMAWAMIMVLLPRSAMAATDPLTTTDAVDGLAVSVDYSTEKIYLQKNSSTDYTVRCDSSNGYYPFSFSMIMSSRTLVDGRPAVSDGGSFSWAYDETTGQESATTPYGLVTLPVGSASTVTVTTTGGGTVTFHCAAPNGGTSASGSNVSAYLPAPGQFTNEGVTAGGWGDVYDSTGTLKNNTTTGVSLGFFGGYVVYKFTDPVANASTNPYGADFIVYGNAFWGNCEPGCVQVSQDGSTWYDIAGSKYYDSDTVHNATITYTNPNVTEDAGITAAGANLGTLAAVSYSLNGTPGTITTNSFHNHSWFPLNANYFSGRYGNTALDQVSALPFASRTTSSGVTGTLTLTGTELGAISTSDTAGFGFGYCDVHPNKTLGGNTAYNPYQSFSSSSDYNTKAANTSGGDPIDISWAVDSNGMPKYLSSIQYVRIYTGTAQMNGIFGEVSTEALGVAACTGTGTGTATDSLTLKSGRVTISHGSMAVTSTNYTSIKLTSSADYIYVNGAAVTSGTTLDYSGLNSGESQMVQIITQTGTESPYITYLEVTKS